MSEVSMIATRLGSDVLGGSEISIFLSRLSIIMSIRSLTRMPAISLLIEDGNNLGDKPAIVAAL